MPAVRPLQLAQVRQRLDSERAHAEPLGSSYSVTCTHYSPRLQKRKDEQGGGGGIDSIQLLPFHAADMHHPPGTRRIPPLVLASWQA